MKIYTCCVLALLLTINAIAQKNSKAEPTFYVFNENEEPCKIEDATYLGVLEKLSDTAYQWKYYHYSGSLIRIETYVKKSLEIPHGYFAYFDAWGRIDSGGYIYNNQKDQKWYHFNDSIKIIQTEDYYRGTLLERKTREDLEKEKNDSKNDSSIASKFEKEANYRGGESGWRKYLEKNLRIPDRTIDLLKNGTTMTYFMVDTDGSVQGIFLAKSVEYSFDEAVMALIKNAPAWEPALKNGKPVKAYRIQPVTVMTSDDSRK
jgi:periplasmic protein TonB